MSEQKSTLLKKRWLQLHEDDQVAVALAELQPGEEIGGVTITEVIPRWHKVALQPVEFGSPVRKYGQIIGDATADIEVGSWVHTHNLGMGKLLEPNVSAFCTNAPPDPAPVTDRYFLGYRRADGRAATRNHILLASTVDCSNHVIDQAIRELRLKQDELLRKYPNVDGIAGLTHDSGCGLALLSEAHQRQNRTIDAFLEHPNTATKIVVGLGCEKGQPEYIYGSSKLLEIDDGRRISGQTPLTLTIQEEGGTQETVDKIIAAVVRILPEINRIRRVLIPASELVLATQCGGSNALSGITANPAIGVASDLLVACGGTSFFAESTETFGAEHLLTSRAKTPEIARAYLDHLQWWKAHLASFGHTFGNNPTPGNKAGGLTTIAEKSLGSVAKGGSTALCGVFDYAEQVDKPGLCFMNTPAFDPVSCTGQTAGGALVGLFSTGQGSCFGGLLVPWIKVVSNTETWERMVEMEINAGVVLDGVPIRDVGRQIFEQVLAVASGAKTYSEKLGVAVFNMWNTGVTT
jgi:altronate hydrolase